jgi:hypothetical protein
VQDEALDYDTLLQESPGCGPAVVLKDQLCMNAETGNAAPILTFTKDVVDTLDFKKGGSAIALLRYQHRGTKQVRHQA